MPPRRRNTTSSTPRPSNAIRWRSFPRPVPHAASGSASTIRTVGIGTKPNATGLINDWDFGPLNKRKPDSYFRQKSLPQVEELASHYKPALIWFDVPDLTRQRSEEFLTVIRRHVPGLHRQRPHRQRPGRLRHARAVHPGQRNAGTRLGNLHDHQRYLGLQVVRHQLQVDRNAASESDRHRQQGRQLSAQRRPDGRGPDPGSRSAAAQGNGRLAEGERRGDLRHVGGPVEEGAGVGAGDAKARQIVPARLRLADNGKTAVAGDRQGGQGLSSGSAWANAATDGRRRRRGNPMCRPSRSIRLPA